MKKIYTGLAALALVLGIKAQNYNYILDKNYGGKGFVFSTNIAPGLTEGNATTILLNDDGSEYYGIRQGTDQNAKPIVGAVKRKANGTADSSFATNSVASDYTFSDISFFNISPLKDNKIYFSGNGWGGFAYSGGQWLSQSYFPFVAGVYGIGARDGGKISDTTVVQAGNNEISYYRVNTATGSNNYINFNYSGSLQYSISGVQSTPSFQAVATVPNQCYYVAGVMDTFAFIAKYKAGGFSFDSTWGTNGIAAFSLFNINSAPYIHDVKVQTDGKVLISYYAQPNATLNNDDYVRRYNTDGTLDVGFGNNGIVKISKGSKIATLPGGDIALLHSYSFSATNEVGILLLNNSGTFIGLKEYPVTLPSGYQHPFTHIGDISVNAAGDIALCGGIADSTTGSQKPFTMRLKRVSCNITGSITNISNFNATVNFSGSQLYPVIVTVGIEGALFTDSLTSGNSTEAYGLDSNTTYTATVTDANGCKWEQSFTTTSSTNVGINDITEVSSNIYPNPAKNILNINCSEAIEGIQITNITGSVIYKATNLNITATQITTADYPATMYYVQITTKCGKTTVKPFVKQ